MLPQEKSMGATQAVSRAKEPIGTPSGILRSELVATRCCFMGPGGEVTSPRVLNCKQRGLAIREKENFAGLGKHDLVKGTKVG